MNWTVLTQDKDKLQALVNTDMNLQIPNNAENFSISCKTIGFSRRTVPHSQLLDWSVHLSVTVSSLFNPSTIQ